MKKILSFFLIGILVGSGLGAIGISNSNVTNGHDMVIICPKEFSKIVQKLIDHKNKHGIETFLMTTDEIYHQYEGKDNAEKIKYFIKDAIESEGIQYALLVGGHKGQLFSWNVPARIVHLADGARYTEYTSDLYYSDIYRQDGSFEDWNSNGDDVIGEWGKDSFDLMPDIAVGRLPCRTISEVERIVDKIIEYETMSFDESWFNRLLVAGGDSIPNTGDPFPYEGEILCDEAIAIMDGFSQMKLYASDTSLVDYTDFIDGWNYGSGFTLYSGRAGPSSLLTYDKNGNPITPLHVKQINQLHNKGKYPVFIINGCMSGKFEVTILNILKLLFNKPNIELSDVAFDCIGWKIVNQKDGGAIATIAPTSQCWVGLGDTDDNQIPDIIETTSGFLSLEFLRVYAEEGIDTLGNMYTKAIKNYIDVFPVYSDKIDCKTIQEYCLIGDPSLKIGGYE